MSFYDIRLDIVTRHPRVRYLVHQLCLVENRSAFDQVSEFDRGRIVAYRDCGLSFREVGSHVGRNQTTVMGICDRWMHENSTDRRGRSHPPHCTTSREDRQILRMAAMDHSVTLRTVAQHIESVTHHSVSVRTMRRRLKHSGLSAGRSLLGLPLTQNHRRLLHQWHDERRMRVAEWNVAVFTNESRICLQHHDGRIRVWRHGGEKMLNSCVIHYQTGPAPGLTWEQDILVLKLSPWLHNENEVDDWISLDQWRNWFKSPVRDSNRRQDIVSLNKFKTIKNSGRNSPMSMNL
ncbi:transposable element Tcb1 transposase [Trichonephila clavipes]|nr:transposable element Tcb1 transposase [Trichonephila clavipes]